MAKYETMYSGGDYCTDNDRLFIQTYSNTSKSSDVVSYKYSAVNEGLQRACDGLLDSGAISYYEIDRFKAEDYNYPKINVQDAQDTADLLSDYLKNDNGTGDDLLAIRGVHLLLHEENCDVNFAAFDLGDEGDCNATDDNDPFGAPDTKQNAFSQGRMAWSPLTCDDGKTQASAVQEPLHNFIMHRHPDVKPMLYDDDTSGDTETEIDRFDEHSLGRIYFDDGSGVYKMTPMLTYHDYQFSRSNTCNGSDKDQINNHTPELSECAKRAVQYVAEDSDCNDQPSNVC